MARKEKDSFRYKTKEQWNIIATQVQQHLLHVWYLSISSLCYKLRNLFSLSCIIDGRIIITFCIHNIKVCIHTKIQSEYVRRRRRKLVVVLTSNLPDCRYKIVQIIFTPIFLIQISNFDKSTFLMWCIIYVEKNY